MLCEARRRTSSERKMTVATVSSVRPAETRFSRTSAEAAVGRRRASANVPGRLHELTGHI